jgi:F420-non-reducing hydrogenase iron-sulfur subunit
VSNNSSSRITAFLCHWGPFPAAEGVGIEQHLPEGTFRLVRVFCSGRVDPAAIVGSLLKGSDGVMVLGCKSGECHYVNGNCYAEKRIKWVKRFLQLIEINPERIFNDWLSTQEGEKLVSFINQFTGKIKELGKLGESEGLDSDEVKLRLGALREVLNDERLRWLLGIESEFSGKENAFGEKVTEEEYNQIVVESFLTEYKRKKILLTIRDEPMSVEAISQKLNLPMNEVLRDVVVLNSKGSVILDRVEDDIPLYLGMRT